MVRVSHGEMRSSDEVMVSIRASLSAIRSPKSAMATFLGFAFLLVGLLPLDSALGNCVTDFKRPPRDFFDNVDRRGYVHIVRQIGQVLDSGEIPIHVIFRTSQGANSPHLGRNFDLTITDAKIFSEDTNSKIAYFPCGWLYRFWVDKKNPSIWHGTAGWKAEVRGDVFTGVRSCGKGKVVFNLKNGRILSFNDGEREFQYIYEVNGSGLREVTIDGNRAVRILRENVGSNEVTGLELPLTGQRLAFEREDRMIISKASGRNIMTERVSALSKVAMQEAVITLAFAQDSDGNPTIEVSNYEDGSPTLVAFDAATGKVLRDGDWSYSSIGDPEKPFLSVPLERVNAKGQKEYYFKDTLTGVETTLRADGTKKVTTRFTGGSMSGKVRTIEEFLNDKSTRLEKFFYDGNGNLSHCEEGDETVFYQRSSDGAIAVRRVKNGVIVSASLQKGGKVLWHERENLTDTNITENVMKILPQFYDKNDKSNK